MAELDRACDSELRRQLVTQDALGLLSRSVVHLLQGLPAFAGANGNFDGEAHDGVDGGLGHTAPAFLARSSMAFRASITVEACATRRNFTSDSPMMIRRPP